MFRYVKLILLYRRSLFISLCKLYDLFVEFGFLGYVIQVEILVGGDGDEVQEEGAVFDFYFLVVVLGFLLLSYDFLISELFVVLVFLKFFLGYFVWNNFKDFYMLILFIYFWFKIIRYYYKFENIFFDIVICKFGMNY